MQKIDDRIQNIMNIFTANKEEIYVVGGAIRDLLLGLTPLDYDLTTSALPFVIENMLQDYNLDKKGRQFGSYSFEIDELTIQVTTFRKEEYKNFHYPSKIIFTDTLLEDLNRRDFTINAICYADNKIIDLLDGTTDLQKRLLRLIGDKKVRFKQDPLRIIRGLRFAINLDLDIEEETLKQMKEDFHLIKELSSSLIKKELELVNKEKLFNSPLKQLILSISKDKL